MARSVAELKAEMNALGIPLTEEMTRGRGNKKPMMDALAEAKNQGVDLLDQVEVMLCRDAKDWVDVHAPDPFNTPDMESRFWENPQWVVEEKLDGNRLKVHLTPGGIRSDSRRRSDETYVFSEKTGNFPHLEKTYVPVEMYGTILDGEVMCPKSVVDTGAVITSSTQQSTSAIANSGKNKAVAIQKNNDAWVEYHAFDVIKYAGDDVTQQPFWKRRKLLKGIVRQLSGHSKYWKVSKLATEDKREFFHNIVASGGEGVILKDINSKYEPDKRSKGQFKLKRFQTQDGYIVGWIPGENANEGLVGAVEVACQINGKEHKFASVSQFTQVERYSLTAEDGSLKPEFYGRVVEVRGQILTKNGRFQHAVFLGWRPDKSADMCDGYELQSDLEGLGFKFPEKIEPSKFQGDLFDAG